MVEVQNVPKITLYYFNLHGRGEAIRLLLSHSGIKYKDKRISFLRWILTKSQKKYEFHQLPVLQLDKEYFSQSASILRYLGVLLGYYPIDPVKALEVDMLLDAVADYYKLFLSLVHPINKKEKGNIEDLEKAFRVLMNALERRLKDKDDKNFIIGGSLTIVDFAIIGAGISSFINPKNSKLFVDWIEDYPALLDYIENAKLNFHKYFHSLKYKNI